MTRVLLHDDDIALAELMRVVLVEAGCDVTVWSAHDDPPRGPFDRIVTDLLPSRGYSFEDARDWLLRLADRHPNVPIIVVTGYSQAQQDAAALGAHRVVLKPFELDQFVAAVTS